MEKSGGAARAMALLLAFILVLLIWAAGLSVLYASTKMPDADAKDVSALGFCIVIVAIASTFWLANLINNTLTGEDIW